MRELLYAGTLSGSLEDDLCSVGCKTTCVLLGAAATGVWEKQWAWFVVSFL